MQGLRSFQELIHNFSVQNDPVERLYDIDSLQFTFYGYACVQLDKDIREHG